MKTSFCFTEVKRKVQIKGTFNRYYWAIILKNNLILNLVFKIGFQKAMEALYYKSKVYLNHRFSPTGQSLLPCLENPCSLGSPHKQPCLRTCIKSG